MDSLASLSDPTRCRVFECLREGPLPVGELARRLPVSRPAVSQHLKILADAGLVTATADGNRRLYSVRAEALAELRTWLDQFWDDVLDRFAAATHEPGGPD